MSIKLKHSGGNSVSLNPPTSAPTSSEVAFKLPNADGSANQLLKTDGSGNLGFVAQGLAGITELDQWYLTSNHTSSGDITSNLSRNAQTGSASPLGTGMSESSGIFSFPSTGKWLILLNGKFMINGQDNCDVVLNATTNNSSYTGVLICTDGQNGSGAKEGSAAGAYFLDVTDVSQVKVKFSASSLGSGSYVSGTSTMQTHFTFIRIGDT